MNNEHFKANTSKLVLGLIVLIFGIIVEAALIIGGRQEEDGIFIIIGGTIFLAGWFFLIAFSLLSNYFSAAKYIKKSLAKYSEDVIKAHIASSQELVYSKAGKSTYFTDRAIVDFQQGVFPYNMIVMAHVTKVKNKNYVTSTTITIYTFDGEIFPICSKISSDEAEKYLELMYKHNPKMIIGYSEENLAQRGKLVDDYSAGKIVIPETTL